MIKLAIIADELLKTEFFLKKLPVYANVCVVQEPQNVPADSYLVFDLLFEPSKERIQLLETFLPRLVFINAVVDTLAEICQPFIRINAWPTLLKRDILEIAALPAQHELVKDTMKKLNWQYQLVPDITGMVSARIISNIVNEAYFALGEQVSTRQEIDTAMKTGTNYPYGPFDWSQKIGLESIYNLLLRLCKENNAYKVATLLIDECNNPPVASQ